MTTRERMTPPRTARRRTRARMRTARVAAARIDDASRHRARTNHSLSRRASAASARVRAGGARKRGGARAGGADAVESSSRMTDAPSVRVRAMETASSTQRTDLAVVLVEPRIPGNTGCVARSCAAARVPLHLVNPLFELDDARLKRAGLDYWKSVCVRVHPSWEAFHEYWMALDAPRKRLVGFSKLGARPHAEEGAYEPGDWLLFGAEDKGLREEAMEACRRTGGIRRIPIDETHVRSLNLSVSAGIGIYEALRQLDGPPVVRD